MSNINQFGETFLNEYYSVDPGIKKSFQKIRTLVFDTITGREHRIPIKRLKVEKGNFLDGYYGKLEGIVDDMSLSLYINGTVLMEINQENLVQALIHGHFVDQEVDDSEMFLEYYLEDGEVIYEAYWISTDENLMLDTIVDQQRNIYSQEDFLFNEEGQATVSSICVFLDIAKNKSF